MTLGKDYEFDERVAILMTENGWSERRAIAECLEQMRRSAQGLVAEQAMQAKPDRKSVV